MRHHRRVMGLLGAVFVLAGPVWGQGPVVGRVVDGETGLPVPSASVVAVNGAGADGARALSDAAGRFVLDAGAATALRVTRLGYAPVRYALADPDAFAEIRIRPRPFELDALVATGETECRGRTLGDTPALAALWLQVIEAYAVAGRDDGVPLRYDVQEFRRRLAPDGVRVEDETFELARRRGGRPFVGLTPAPEGVTRFIREEGDSVVFLAPDDRVLGSPSFQEQFCLDVVDARADGRLGLRFRPRRDGDLTGVFWLAADGSDLLELSLVYRDERWRGQGGEATGSLRFTRLPDGRVVVGGWTLTVPEIEVVEGGSLLDDRRIRVRAVHEFGGRLVAAATDRGEPVFDAGSGVVVGRVERPGGGPAPDGTRIDVVGGPSELALTRDGAFRLPPLPAGRYTVRAVHAADPAVWAEAAVDVTEGSTPALDLRLREAWERRLDVCPAGGLWLELTAPRGLVAPGTSVAVRISRTGSLGRTAVDRDGGVTLCGADDAVRVTVAGFAPVEIGGGTGHRSVPLTRPVAEEPRGTTAVRVQALDLDTGRPVGSAAVWVDDAVTTADDGGVAHIGGLRSGDRILRVEALGYVAFEDTVRVASGTLAEFDVHLAPRAFELEGLTVEVAARESMAWRALGDRFRTYPLQVVGPEQLARERALGLRALLEREGVRFDRVGLLTERGCRPAVWIDGLRVSGVDAGAARPYDVTHLRLEDLQAVEVHRGGRVPIDLLGPGDRCGVVAFWTAPPALTPT